MWYRAVAVLLALAVAAAPACAGLRNPDLPDGGVALDLRYGWEHGRHELVQDHSGNEDHHRLGISVLRALSSSVTAEIGFAAHLYREPRLQVDMYEDELVFRQCTPEEFRHSFEVSARMRIYLGQRG